MAGKNLPQSAHTIHNTFTSYQTETHITTCEMVRLACFPQSAGAPFVPAGR